MKFPLKCASFAEIYANWHENALMAEWSKAVALGAILVRGVGSNPTQCISSFFFFLISTPTCCARLGIRGYHLKSDEA
jgi:hypothetical protein